MARLCLHSKFDSIVWTKKMSKWIMLKIFLNKNKINILYIYTLYTLYVLYVRKLKLRTFQGSPVRKLKPSNVEFIIFFQISII